MPAARAAPAAARLEIALDFQRLDGRRDGRLVLLVSVVVGGQLGGRRRRRHRRRVVVVPERLG